MKNLFLLTCLMACILTSKAQEGTFFSFGYNFSNIKNKNVNEIIDRYNTTNTWLSEGFGTYNKLGGLLIEVNVWNENSMASIGWSGRNNLLFAEGDDSLGVYRAFDLRHRYNYAYVNYFWNVINTRRFKLGPGLGGGVATYKIQRRNTIDQNQYEYGDIIRSHQFIVNILLNMSIFMGEHFSLNIQPYFQMPFMRNTEVDFIHLDRDLNPSYSPPENKDYMEWTLSSGIIFTLSLGGD